MSNLEFWLWCLFWWVFFMPFSIVVWGLFFIAVEIAHDPVRARKGMG